MKVVIFGAKGQMGRAIISLYEEEKRDVEIISVDRDFPGPLDAIGEAQVALDFSGKEALGSVLKYCRTMRVPLVLGTTGHDEKDKEEIRRASQEIPVFYSGNFSLGIYVLKSVLKEAARLLGEDVDVEIIEKHHKRKKDAPSGTALLLLDALKKEDREQNLVFGRQGMSQREAGEIGMHSVRGGTMVGEHTVLFAMDHETLEFTHRGESRGLFAKGAVKAADYLMTRQAGLYSMDHMMKERDE